MEEGPGPRNARNVALEAGNEKEMGYPPEGSLQREGIHAFKGGRSFSLGQMKL